MHSQAAGRYQRLQMRSRDPRQRSFCSPTSFPGRGCKFEWRAVCSRIFGIPSQALFGRFAARPDQRLVLRAALSLGLATVIFGMLNIINFTHGAQYMMGAFAAYFLLQRLRHSGRTSHFTGTWPPTFTSVHFGVGPAIAGTWLDIHVGADRRRAQRPASSSSRSFCSTCASSIRFTACSSPSALASSSKACSATPTDRPASPIKRPRRCRAAATSASCSCRTTARGSSSSRGWFARHLVWH